MRYEPRSAHFYETKPITITHPRPSVVTAGLRVHWTSASTAYNDSSALTVAAICPNTVSSATPSVEHAKRKITNPDQP